MDDQLRVVIPVGGRARDGGGSGSGSGENGGGSTNEVVGVGIGLSKLLSFCIYMCYNNAS